MWVLYLFMALLLACLGFAYWLEWWKWNAKMADEKAKAVKQ